MREILPNQLWIGNAGDGRDAERLLQNGVVVVINLAAEEPSPILPRSMIYCHFPLADGPQDDEDVLDVAIQTVVSLLKKRIPTLVYGRRFWKFVESCNRGIANVRTVY